MQGLSDMPSEGRGETQEFQSDVLPKMQGLCDMPSEGGGQTQEFQSDVLPNARIMDYVRNMLERSDSMNPANRITNYRKVMISAFAALQEMYQRRDNSSFCEADVKPRPGIHVSSSQLKLQEDGRAKSVDLSSLHEDTEDLEALLGSDEDESSTANSPSDITWTNGTVNGTVGYCDLQAMSKSINEPSELDSDDESEVNSFYREESNQPSSFTGNDNTFGTMHMSSAEREESALSYRKARQGDSLGRSAFLGVRNPSPKASARSYDPKPKGSFSMGLGLSKKSRQDKIKKTINMLRRVIPCGDDTNTAVILDEAIGYVRFLQHKVYQLEATRDMQAQIIIDPSTKSTQESESCVLPNEYSLQHNSPQNTIS
ncbi:hypothetical protein O6H91_Y016300 [Diphasiastrum complanatum]|nr:hypothetical protein O6H91_Y016300 [Diphasiastrum complanatum]